MLEIVGPAMFDAVAIRQMTLPRSSIRLKKVGKNHTRPFLDTAYLMHRIRQKKSSTSVASG